MENVIKKILEYYSVGYSLQEIVTEIAPELGLDEDKNFDFVNYTIKKAQKTMSPEEKEKIAELRKIRKDQVKYNKMIEIADQVKNRVFLNTAIKKESDKLIEAASFVAKNNGLTLSIVRNYTKLVYPCFYSECVNNNFMDDKYFEDMARRIIDNKMLKTHCSQMMGFEAMLSYLAKYRPELLDELNNSFAEASAKFNKNEFVELEGHIYNSNTRRLLIEIALKFRLPFKVMCEFLTNNPTFMNVDSITEEEFINSFKGNVDTRAAVKSYMYEMASYSNPENYDEYVNYRIMKFNEFVKKFNLVKDDFEKLSKLVQAETAISLGEVKRKVAEHDPNRHYKFDHNDKKNIIEFVYRYALGEEGVADSLGIPSFYRTDIVSTFVPENFEEEMLLVGYNKMVEYKSDVAYAYRVGRK